MGLNDVYAPRTGETAIKNIGTAAVEVFDVTGPDSEGRVLVPCRQLIIRTAGANVKFAEKAGEIEAGRFITIEGSLQLNGARNGVFYMQAVGADTDVEILAR